MWVLRIKLRLSQVDSKHLYLLRHFMLAHKDKINCILILSMQLLLHEELNLALIFDTAELSFTFFRVGMFFFKKNWG